MTPTEWVAEINRRLQADVRYQEGMRYLSVRGDDGKVVGTTWEDSKGGDANSELFFRISNEMCTEHPLIEE